MRVLMTTDTVGGVWTFTGTLAQELLERGHAVHLVSFGRAPSPEQRSWCMDEAQRFAQQFTFSFSEVPLEWMQENERAFEDGEMHLLAQVEQFQPDLVLANQFCFGRLNVAVPRVVVGHSDVLSWAKACRPSALEPSPWLNRYTAMVQAGLLNATAVAVPTAAMGKALAASFFLPNNYYVIPNGRTLPAVTPPLAERPVQAVSAGRLWDEAKGLDILSRCELPLPVLLAGEPRFEGESAPALPANVCVLGSLPSTDLHALFRQSSIYLCTSRYEPFGLALVEAAHCGCAVIAHDLPSLREIWGDDALYFDDDMSFVAQVRRLSEDKAERVEMQSRAQSRASRYTAARMAEAYLALFEHVLAQTGQRSQAKEAHVA